METIPSMQSAFEREHRCADGGALGQIGKAQAAPAVVAGAPAAHPAPIPNELFVQHLQGMQQHYIARPAVSKAVYVLPPHLIPPPTVAATVGAKAVDAVLERIHVGTLAAVQNHANSLTAAAAHAESAKMTTTQFAASMNALREKDKANAAAKINQYSTLGEVGKQHADQRPRIPQAANSSGGFLATLGADMQQISHEL